MHQASNVKPCISWYTSCVMEREFGGYSPEAFTSTPESKPDVSSQDAEEQSPREQDPEEASEVVMVPYESLPHEEQQRVTDRVIDKMRSVLRDIPDYALFASTAMYLNGKRLKALRDPGAGELLKVAPGDLDIAVGSMESLKRIRERLSNVPGVFFDHDGRFKQLPSGEAQVLAGSIIVPTEKGDVKYDFEFFNENKIVPDEVRRNRVQVDGVYTLNLEGLQKQYLNNLELEGRVDRLTEQRMKALQQHPRIRSEIFSGAMSEEVATLLASMDLAASDAKEFYALQDQIDATEEGPDRQALISRRAIALTGLKTKLPKRIKSVETVARLRGRTE